MKRLVLFILAVAIILAAGFLACLHIADSVSRDIDRNAHDAERGAAWTQIGGEKR